MIIRLIDIVLIVLFGFITISDIDIKGALSLPSKKAKVTQSSPKKPKVFVEVEIDENDRFYVSRLGQQKVTATGIRKLEVALVTLRSRIQKTEGSDIAVIIKPREMSPIQSTVDVLDLCGRHKIPKNIARRSMALF